MKTREQLITEAEKLKQCSDATLLDFSIKKNIIHDAIDKKMSSRNDIDNLVGIQNIEMMHDNHGNHLRFMESIFLKYSAATFVETILWVFRTYRAHGFSAAYWPAFLNALTTVYRETLTEQAANEIIPFYEWIIIHIPVFSALTDE